MKGKKPLIITVVSSLLTLLFALTSFAAESGFTSGVVSEVTEDSMSIEDGTTCIIDEFTVIQGELVVGAEVQVFDRSELDTCVYTVIIVSSEENNEDIDFSGEATNTPTPAATLEPTPAPTVEATLEPTVEPTVDVDPTVEVQPTATQEAPVPTEESTPVVDPEPTVEPTPEIDPTPEPTEEPTVDPTPDPEPNPEIIEGEITDYSNRSITVGDQVCSVNRRTQVRGRVRIGRMATIKAEYDDEGNCYAKRINVERNNPDWYIGLPEYKHLYGEVEAFSDTEVTVDGETCNLSADTQIAGDLAVGSTIYLSGTVEDDICTADTIYVKEPVIRYTRIHERGEVTAISDENVTVNGVTCALSEDTYVRGGDIAVGDTVNMVGFVDAEDTCITHKLKKRGYAQPDPDVEVVDYTYVMGIVSSVSDSELIIAENTFVLNEETEIFGELVEGANVHVIAVTAEDGTLVAKAIEVFEEEVQEELPTYLRGTVADVTAGAFTIDGTSVAITADTTITGDLADGAKVFVQADAAEDDTLTAIMIIVKRNAPVAGETSFTIHGKIQAISDTEIEIRHHTVGLTAETTMPDELAEDDKVRVTVNKSEDGTLTATNIEKLGSGIIGRVDSISDTGVWVSGNWYRFGEGCEIEGDITVGDTVEIGTEDPSMQSSLLRAATSTTAEETALLITPASLAPTSISLTESGASPMSNATPLLWGGFASLFLLLTGMFMWRRQL